MKHYRFCARGTNRRRVCFASAGVFLMLHLRNAQTNAESINNLDKRPLPKLKFVLGTT